MSRDFQRMNSYAETDRMIHQQAGDVVLTQRRLMIRSSCQLTQPLLVQVEIYIHAHGCAGGLAIFKRRFELPTMHRLERLFV
jgi:hypothetical protein